MKTLTQFTSLAVLAAMTIFANEISAQTASGTSQAACSQNGQTVTCTTTTTYNLSSGLNLQSQTSGSSFTLTPGIVTPAAPAGCAVIPASQSAAVGSSPTLNVGCSAGNGNYTYQWTKNGTNISGATSQSYTLNASSDTATPNTGTYSVLITNSIGSNYASAGTVSVTSQSAIAPSGCSVTPPSASITVGGSQTLSASCAVGTSPFNYAWYKNGSQLSGATSSTYSLSGSDTAASGSGSTYRVDVSNSAGTSSATGSVTVTPPSACTSNGSPNSVIDVNTGYKQVGSSNLFGTGNTYIIRLDVSASSSTVGGLTALLSHTEGVGSQRAFRAISISPCAGDFTSSAAITLAVNSVGSTSDLALNDPGRGVPNLTTGTWYVNIKNTACTANTRCDVLVDYLHY